MKHSVACFQRRAFEASEPAEGVVQRVGGELWVELRERLAQAFGEHNLRVIIPFGEGFSWRDLKAMLDGPAKALQPGEGGLLDV